MKTVAENIQKELGERILAEQRAARARLWALERNLGIAPAGPIGDNTPLADPLEAANQEVAEFELEGSREALIRRLKKLYRAAEKVREGSYGDCDMCGEAIPMARLQAVPEAVYCRDCAAELERTSAARPRRERIRMWSEDELPIAA